MSTGAISTIEDIIPQPTTYGVIAPAANQDFADNIAKYRRIGSTFIYQLIDNVLPN